MLSRAEGSVNDGSPPGMLDALRIDGASGWRSVEEEHRSRPLESLVREVILPLAELIGDQWALGKLSVAVEHLASDVVIAALKRELELGRGKGPVLLAACLQGERHEWGLLCHLVLLARPGDPAVAEPRGPLDRGACTRADPDGNRLRRQQPERALSDLRRLPRLVAPGLVIVMGTGRRCIRLAAEAVRVQGGDGAVPPVT